MGFYDFFIVPDDLPDDVYGFVQVLFLLVVYGYILSVGSNMISDGSELLLLVPALAGVVGSIVLPVLGAVPDGAIVLFSGLGDDAQDQLDVGVGALAGSTIMLLTVPWFMSIAAGRVNIDPESGVPVYKRPPGASKDWSKLWPPNNRSLTGTGVLGTKQVRIGGYLLLITASSYLLIQGPAFATTGESDSEISSVEKWFAFTGLFTCTIMFAGYLYYQWKITQKDNEVLEDVIQEIQREQIQKGQVSLRGLMQGELMKLKESAGSQWGSSESQQSLLPETRTRRRLEALLRPFFEHYDEDRSGHLDFREISAVLQDLHEKVTPSDVKRLFAEFDRDNSGKVDFQEFVLGIVKYMLDNSEGLTQAAQRNDTAVLAYPVEPDEDEVEEEEEVPEDLADLSPEEQQMWIKLRAFWTMGLGTVIVLVFSDPMVSVLDSLGTRTGISSFYISFILSPLASNASELIASYKYAAKKTTKTIQISLATLQGAGCMNNTFCLGVFLALIFFRGLAWTFSAETTSILLVEILMAIMSFRKVHRLLDGVIVLTFYPLSLAVVAGLEALGWD